MRWLPCAGCGKAWGSKTEPLILGNISGSYRYRCARCGKPGSVSPTQFARLPRVSWDELDRYFPDHIRSHYED